MDELNELNNPQTSMYEYDGIRVILTTRQHTVSDVLTAFEYALRGQGYVIDGHLEVVKDE